MVRGIGNWSSNGCGLFWQAESVEEVWPGADSCRPLIQRRFCRWESVHGAGASLLFTPAAPAGLPGLPKFLEQAGPVLIAPPAEPALDLPGAAAAFLREALDVCLQG